MRVAVACPKCKRQADFDGGMLGKVVTCPHCDDWLKMPPFVELDEPQLPARKPAIPSFERQFEQPIKPSPQVQVNVGAEGGAMLRIIVILLFIIASPIMLSMLWLAFSFLRSVIQQHPPQ